MKRFPAAGGFRSRTPEEVLPRLAIAVLPWWLAGLSAILAGIMTKSEEAGSLATAGLLNGTWSMSRDVEAV